jgi:hypothetical protein
VLDGGRTALSWSADKSLRVWDLETGVATVLMGTAGTVLVLPI